MSVETDWLQGIPSDWSVLNLRHIGEVILGLTYSPEDVCEPEEGPLVIRASNIQNGKLVHADDVHVISPVPRKIISRRGDIVVCSRNGSRRLIGKSAVVTEDWEGSTFGAFMTTVRTPYSEWMRWVLSSALFEFQSGRFMTSTINQLTTSTLKSFPVPLPPVETQRRIARFLDEKTARIGGLIERKRALLDRLAEKRQALITRTVTKGLDPAAPLKPSGIDWLGDTPAHWETGNIRRFARMKTGHTPTRTVAEYWDDCTIPWFTLADVWQLRDGTRWYLEETSEKISELGLANSAAELLPAGTVVFSRTASVGFSGIMPEPMATSQDFWNWVCGPKLTPEYLLLLFRSMVQKFEESTNGSTHKTIYQGVAAGLQICVPPLEEQRRISTFIFHHMREIDDVIRKVRESVDRLAEYRSALITAAVTGKLAMDAQTERECEEV